MKLDNSQLQAFWTCPELWKERYHYKIVPDGSTESLNFGTRMHNLLELQLRGGGEDRPITANPALESEAQVMLAAYNQHYPLRAPNVVDVERVFEVRLKREQCFYCGFKGEPIATKYGEVFCSRCKKDEPPDHVLTGKIDALVEENTTPKVLEHKTEKRGGKNNLPEAWEVRSQAALYCYAATQLYGREINTVIVDVLTRQSPAGQKSCSFNRFEIFKNAEAQRRAVRDAIYVADQIERLSALYGMEARWPTNTEACTNKMTGWKCDYYSLHHNEGRPVEMLARFKEAEDYLKMDNDTLKELVYISEELDAVATNMSNVHDMLDVRRQELRCKDLSARIKKILLYST